VRSNFPFVISVTLPFGAGPGQQRLFLGPASGFPPALITYLRNNGWDPVGGFIAYATSGGVTDTQYTFLVQAVAFPGEFPAAWVFGSFDTGFFETQAIFQGGNIFVSPFGENITLQVSANNNATIAGLTIALGALAQVLGTLQVVSGGKLEVQSGGQLVVDAGATITIDNTAGFSINNGATVTLGQSGTATIIWTGGCIAQFNSGSHLNMLAGAALSLDNLTTFQVDGTDQPRGIIGASLVTANIGPFGGVNNILSIGNKTFRKGRVYRSMFRCISNNSAAGNNMLASLVKSTGVIINGATRKLLQVAATQDDFYTEFVF
jgi:hypothetical protein